MRGADSAGERDASLLRRCERIAEEVLFPAALQVDEADTVPAAHLDLFADEGLYGLAADRDVGGLGIGLDTALRVVEMFSGACLSTTFVWLQHHSTVLALAGATGSAGSALRERWLGPLATGAVRAGIALAGARPGPPPLRATPVPGGWSFDGEVPWVTGWTMIDVVQTAARDAEDNIVFGLLDATESETLRARRQRLTAVHASNTVTLRFREHVVPAERVIASVPQREWLAKDAAGLRFNGSLPLGLTARCCALLGASPLDDELVAARTALDDAGAAELPAARAGAAELAMRAASALVTATGSGAALRDSQAQRLAREALFLLVFASRPAIKESLLDRFTGGPGG